MCLNNQQPSAPEIKQMAPPPPVKPLQIAQRSTLPTKQVAKEETKPVAFGAKSKRDASKAVKRDAASLLVPMSDTGNTAGGINT